MRCVLAAVLLAACGVRAPAALDVGALIRAKGGDVAQARLDLVIRVQNDPRDVQARLAITVIDDQLGRPSEAIEQFEAVDKLGGPIGTRWHREDKERYARLLERRATARIERGANGVDDLEHVAALGVKVDPQEMERAKLALAVIHLRHVDAGERAKGRAMIAALGKDRPDRAWAGASPNASPEQHAAFGVWLWARGAKREAYEQLAQWKQAAPGAAAAEYSQAYQRALEWWSPDAAMAALIAGSTAGEASPGSGQAGDPPGSAQARPGTSAAASSSSSSAGSSSSQGPATPAPPAGSSSSQGPAPTAGGSTSKGPATTAGGSSSRAATAAPPAGSSSSQERLGSPPGDPASSPATPAAPSVKPPDRRPAEAPELPDLRADAAVAYARTRMMVLTDAGLGQAHPSSAEVWIPSVAQLRAVARAYRRDPAVADRLAGQVVDTMTDAALAHATLGALFDALGDPARARTLWLAASEESAESQIVAGYAGAAARAGDGDATLVIAATAAAASGDPAATYVDVARALLRGNRVVDALTAARTGLDLAGSNTLIELLDLAIEASVLDGRTDQAARLSAQRARLRPPAPTERRDPLVHELEHSPTASTIAAAWTLTRATRDDVEVRGALLHALDADDLRRHTLEQELVQLAAAPDQDRALAAVLALR